MMRIAKSIDYLTVSKTGTGSLDFPSLLNVDGFRREEYIGARSFYKHNWILENGATFSMSDTVAQGQKLEMSGSVLSRVREIVNEQELLVNLLKHRMKATRVDFAIDTLGGKHSPSDAIREYNEGRMMSNARTVHKYDELSGDGLTMYIGSKSSDRRVRIYDKAAEMSLLGDAWTRVELQARKERANLLVCDMATQDVYSVGTQAIVEYVDFPSLDWWVSATRNKANAHVSELPRPVPVFQKWLETQVLPACRRRVGTSEEFIVHEFLATLTVVASRGTSDKGTSDK